MNKDKSAKRAEQEHNMELSEHYTGSQVVIVGLNTLTTTVPPTLPEWSVS